MKDGRFESGDLYDIAGIALITGLTPEKHLTSRGRISFSYPAGPAYEALSRLRAGCSGCIIEYAEILRRLRVEMYEARDAARAGAGR